MSRGGGGMKTLCIDRLWRAESREVSSTLAESTWLFLGDVILDYD